MVTVVGWFVVVASVMVALPAFSAAVASYGRHDKPGAYAATVAALAACCVASCMVTVVGPVNAWLGLVLSTVFAFGALGVIWKDGREPWDVLTAGAGVVKGIWKPSASGGDDDPPADELAPRREHREAVAELPAAVPDPPMSATPPPSASKGNPSMTMPPPPPPPEAPPEGPPAGSMPAGSVADIFTAVQQIIMRAQAEGMPGKHRAIKMFAEMHAYLSRAEHDFARRMSELDQGYPPQVWEPLAKMASHSRASSLAAGESDQALTALARMPLGDVAVSRVRSPHHNELNANT